MPTWSRGTSAPHAGCGAAARRIQRPTKTRVQRACLKGEVVREDLTIDGRPRWQAPLHGEHCERTRAYTSGDNALPGRRHLRGQRAWRECE
jgi:hypothetical protein